MDKYKVVIVDDDDVALENLSFELWKDARFSLEGTARNGRKGKKLIMKVQPDLLFLDVEMPDMTGLELLQEIRDYVSWNMRVVFLYGVRQVYDTGYSGSGIRLSAETFR